MHELTKCVTVCCWKGAERVLLVFWLLVPLKWEQPAGAACQGVSRVDVAVLAGTGHGGRAGIWAGQAGSSACCHSSSSGPRGYGLYTGYSQYGLLYNLHWIFACSVCPVTISFLWQWYSIWYSFFAVEIFKRGRKKYPIVCLRLGKFYLLGLNMRLKMSNYYFQLWWEEV